MDNNNNNWMRGQKRRGATTVRPVITKIFNNTLPLIMPTIIVIVTYAVECVFVRQVWIVFVVMYALSGSVILFIVWVFLFAIQALKDIGGKSICFECTGCRVKSGTHSWGRASGGGETARGGGTIIQLNETVSHVLGKASHCLD